MYVVHVRRRGGGGMRGASVATRLTPARVSICHFCESRKSPNRACFVHYPLTQQNKIFESHIIKILKHLQLSLSAVTT